MRLTRCLLAPLTVSIAVLSAQSETRATVLSMDGEISASPNPNPPPASGNTYAPWGGGFTIVSEYGDNVSGPDQLDVPTVDFGSPPYWYNFHYGNNGEGYTPNVTVAKSLAGNNATRFWPAYGNLTNVAYPALGSEGGKWYWMFTADPGYMVKLVSSDLALFIPGPVNATVNVYSGNDPANLGPLLYISGMISATNVGQTVSLNNTMASALTLEFDLSPGTRMDNWGADNIVFSQIAVPEPLAIGSSAFGGLLVVARRYRRRR